MGTDILYMQECTNREIIHIYIYIFPLCHCNVSYRAPPTSHPPVSSFGEDTAKTEEDIVNTHMWCEV